MRHSSADFNMAHRLHAVLDAVGQHPYASLGELSALTQLPKATVWRLARTLATSRLLVQDSIGYRLGPELVRLGALSSRQAAIARYRPALEDLHARYGGYAWVIAGPDLIRLQPAILVCDPELHELARRMWPAPGHATLVNTASGHVLLTQRKDMRERVAALGVRPQTARSPKDLRELNAILHRTSDSGGAVEVERSILGWSCAAAPIALPNGELAIAGIVIPAGGADEREMLRAVRKLADLGPY